MKLMINSGKYKGVTANGKDYETAHKNLRNKVNRKEKKEIFESFTRQEIDCLFALFDCQIGSMSKSDFLREVICEGDVWNLTTPSQVDDLSAKLQNLRRYV